MQVDIFNSIPNVEGNEDIHFIFPMNEQTFNNYVAYKEDVKNEFLILVLNTKEWSNLIDKNVHLVLNDILGDYIDYYIMSGESPIAYGKDNICAMNEKLKNYYKNTHLYGEEKEFFLLLLKLFDTFLEQERDYYAFEIHWY